MTLAWLAIVTVALCAVIWWTRRRLMTVDSDLTGLEGRIGTAITSVKGEIASLTAALQAAAGGDGLTADQAAAHVATLQGLTAQLEALEAPAAPPAAPTSGD